MCAHSISAKIHIQQWNTITSFFFYFFRFFSSMVSWLLTSVRMLFDPCVQFFFKHVFFISSPVRFKCVSLFYFWYFRFLPIASLSVLSLNICYPPSHLSLTLPLLSRILCFWIIFFFGFSCVVFAWFVHDDFRVRYLFYFIRYFCEHFGSSRKKLGSIFYPHTHISLHSFVQTRQSVYDMR